MKLVLCVLLAFFFLSCMGQDVSSIQEIVNQWIEIEQQFNTTKDLNEELADALANVSYDFYLSLLRFQESDLYRIYTRVVPFSPQYERGYLHSFTYIDIPEFELTSDLVLIFRDSIISGDMEKASAAAAEISSVIIRLLLIEKETQQFIGFSYNNLIITFLVFFLIAALLIFLMYQSLTSSQKRETEGTTFSHNYMLAQDEERARISRELHDTIIQDMRYLLLETEKIGNTEEKKEREILSGKTVPMMASLIRKTRDMCDSLIPPDFRFNELPNALRQLCFDFGEKTKIDCRAEIEENIKLDFLTMEKRLQIFRIIQEALSNIEKHAEAKEAIVTMRAGKDGKVYIGIDDDGKGFNSPLDKNGQIISGIDKSHIGIISMKERAAILGGSLKIESEIGEGTLICLEFHPPSNSTRNGNGSFIN
ncbi:MAG: histidine kinase [Treponema sp.]|nr:histidine kinase [Treponema sp.]